MKKSIIIGIDPGQSNGFAIWQDDTLKLHTFKLFELFECIEALKPQHSKIQVLIENPHLMHYFKSDARADLRQQGAGNVKGTFTHITAYLDARNISWVGLRPNKKANTLGEAKNREAFNKITGYNGMCSTHARDAAMLIYSNVKI